MKTLLIIGVMVVAIIISAIVCENVVYAASCPEDTCGYWRCTTVNRLHKYCGNHPGAGDPCPAHNGKVKSNSTSGGDCEENWDCG